MIFKPTFRDNLGRFSTNRVLLIRILKVIGFIILVELALIGVENMLIDFNRLTSRYGVQKPIVIMTDDPDGETVFRIVKRPVIYSKPPLVIFSPVVKAVYESVDTKSLNSVEQEILDVFGLEDFQVARAIAKAESGLRVEAFHANDNGTIDLGIFQINSVHFNRKSCSMAELVTLEGNIKCAKQIYDEQGWNPWVVFQTSAFRGNL